MIAGLPCRSAKQNAHHVSMFEFDRFAVQINLERGQATIEDVPDGSLGARRSFAGRNRGGIAGIIFPTAVPGL